MIVYFNFIITNITISPDKNYQVSYNRYSQVITLERISGNSKTHLVNMNNPVFLWSPDSQLLAITYTSTLNNRFTQIFNLENSNGLAPAKSRIQELYNETKTTDTDNDNATIIVSQWLDNNHALVKFSWPSDIQGKTISGWFTYEFPSSAIDGFQMAE